MPNRVLNPKDETRSEAIDIDMNRITYLLSPKGFLLLDKVEKLNDRTIDQSLTFLEYFYDKFGVQHPYIFPNLDGSITLEWYKDTNYSTMKDRNGYLLIRFTPDSELFRYHVWYTYMDSDLEGEHHKIKEYEDVERLENFNKWIDAHYFELCGILSFIRS